MIKIDNERIYKSLIELVRQSIDVAVSTDVECVAHRSIGIANGYIGMAWIAEVIDLDEYTRLKDVARESEHIVGRKFGRV